MKTPYISCPARWAAEKARSQGGTDDFWGFSFNPQRFRDRRTFISAVAAAGGNPAQGFAAHRHGYRMSYKSITRKDGQEEYCQERGEEVEDFSRTFCVYAER